jgi:hypothetical protein
MKKTDCVKNGGDVRACMKVAEPSNDCQEFRHAYYSCKRGGLDARSRIRGPRVY